MTKEIPESPNRNVFISHRHADKLIADTLRKQLQSWGIPEKCIFQSSSYKHSGVIGRPIKQEIRKFLRNTKLVILIYTVHDANWEYCMWECGLATDPETEESRVIVLQCTDSRPRVFRDELLVRADREGIHRFTMQFHAGDSFFPGQGPFAPDMEPEGLTVRTNGLLEALLPILPAQSPRDIVRWGFFTLSLSPDIINQLKAAKGSEESQQVCFSIRDDLIVTRASGWGLRHFGYQDYEPGLSFKSLVERWEQQLQDSHDGKLDRAALDWVGELNQEICRTLRNDPPQLAWTPLKSVYPHIDWWVCPVVNIARYIPDGSVEVDVYMYRVPAPENGRVPTAKKD